MKRALVIVDYQNEWMDENSDYFAGDFSVALEKTNKLIDFCRAQGYKIIFTRHVEKDSDVNFVEESKNAEIISSLHRDDSDTVITKYKISPFYQTNLEKELEGVQEIVVAGILINLCVRSLVQDAYDRDFAITVIRDCCVAFDEETQNFTIKDLKETREEVVFLNVDEFAIK